MRTQEYVLVTGGAGFIGSHLCDALLAKEYSVICLDNLSTGSKENIKHLEHDTNFTFISHDVTKDLPEFPNISYIFHLASPASVIDYQNLPEETALANTVGTRNLLLLAQKTHAKFLFASTSEVYGDPKVHPQPETYWGNVNPVGVRACYDEAKRFGEMLSLLYFRKYRTDARIIRIFNTYGPRMRPTDGRVVSNFINQALKGEPMTMYGTGEQTRSFCFVSDLVEGIMAAMFKGNAGEVYNLGNPEEYTMNDFANKIKVMTNSSSAIEFNSLPQDDPEKRQPDITKAKKELGWEPKISVEEGIKKTIEYYRSLLIS